MIPIEFQWQQVPLYQPLLFLIGSIKRLTKCYYPNAFNDKFETKGPDRNILGMVGDGHLNGTMILSKPALIHCFLNETDKRNTANVFVYVKWFSNLNLLEKNLIQ
jgi:hypothetical protein